jgi:hypothetical protein
MTATEYQLKLVDWQFFATCTWSASALGTAPSRETEQWNWLRDWAIREGCRLAQLPIALRWEKGENGDRPHSHLLISGFPPNAVSIRRCFRQARIWLSKYGLCNVRVYDPKIPGNVYTYVSKMRAKYSAMNQYEICKYDRADRLIINDSAWKLMLRETDAVYVPQAATL